MYRVQLHKKSRLKVNNTYKGETIEAKVRRIVNNKEPITDGAPLVYTERKEGVQAAYDIRTDRWEVAVDAMDKVAKSELAKREARGKKAEDSIAAKAKEGMEKEKKTETEKNGGPEPTQTT